MKLFGLTGGIGTGKSTAARFLSAQGIPVIDTDDVAREIVEVGQPALREVAATFGPSVLEPSGGLNRTALAAIVFSNPAKRERLEAILHPPIRERWLGETAKWRAAGVPLGVIVIPLLFETCAETHFDGVICTACTEVTQRARLAPRNWPTDQAASRMAAQWSLEKKIAAAQYVVWTEGAFEVHHRQLAVLLGRIGQ